MKPILGADGEVMNTRYIPASIALLAICLGGGTAIGTNVASASVGAADPAPVMAAAMSGAVVEVEADEWASDRLVISPVLGTAAVDIATDYRAKVINHTGTYATLTVPEGLNRDAFLAKIRDDTRVLDVTRVPSMPGAGLDGMVGL